MGIVIIKVAKDVLQPEVRKENLMLKREILMACLGKYGCENLAHGPNPCPRLKNRLKLVMPTDRQTVKEGKAR